MVPVPVVRAAAAGQRSFPAATEAHPGTFLDTTMVRAAGTPPAGSAADARARLRDMTERLLA
ncbi:hypothetical protein ACO229_04350 [Promicromonospora sp. MS192]|uniref:hypothetical protein n=1 Tax=Promicromonospora sp. MS192 TaxID=3412684 RepID=UPI003C30BE7E